MDFLKKNKNKIYGMTIILLSLLLYTMWAIKLPMNMAPDEYMRYEIPKWIYQNGKLPIGNESELLNPIWGVSYAFTPYLPSLIAVICMRIVSLFSQADLAMLFAARIPSILAGTGTVLISLKIGDELFERKGTQYLFAILVGFLPQFVFLCTYLNNDAFAIFCGVFIMYTWILGVKYGWSLKVCAMLAVGISACALTYYNAYGYILCSIFVYFITAISRAKKNKNYEIIAKQASFIIIVCIALAGWYFIRNYVIYNGDFLGMKTITKYSEQYGVAEYKPSNRITFKNSGQSIGNMLASTNWISSVVKSSIAVFGYMTIEVSGWLYIIYGLVVLLGILFWSGFSLLDGANQRYRILYLMFLVCIFIPIGLAMYSSYASDYQAQGRYIMPGMPCVMILVSTGYEKLQEKMRMKSSIISFAIIVLWLILFSLVFIQAIAPSCWSGIAIN